MPRLPRKVTLETLETEAPQLGSGGISPGGITTVVTEHKPDAAPPWDYQVFPEMGGVASHLQQATAKLRDTEAREDLKTQANMYNNTLTAQFALRT